MADLPWHPGDHAVTADGWRAVVVAVTSDGRVIEWSETSDWRNLDVWPTDAVPDLAHVGTAAAWLRSCAEVVPRTTPRAAPGAWTESSRRRFGLWHAANTLIAEAHPRLPWSDPDPTLTARAIKATRAYRATLETR